MIQPCRAAVRPRVIAKHGTVPLLLEEEVQEQLQRRCPTPIAILGDAGSGKTTALAHLKAIFGDAVTCLDTPGLVDLRKAQANGPVVYSIPFVDPRNERSLLLKNMSAHQVYWLAPWTKDDLIEYLLAKHKDRCRSVMSRLQSVDDVDYLQGMPLLWTKVLDRMAALETEPTAKSALQGALRELMPDRRAAGSVGWFCAAHFTVDPALVERCEKVLARVGLPADVIQLIKRGPCRLLLAAEQVAVELRRGTVGKCLRYHLPYTLIVEIADRLRGHEGIEQLLASLVPTFPTYTGAMAASLWHLLDRQWLVKYLAAFVTEPAPGLSFLESVVRRIKTLLGPGDKPVMNLPKGYFPQADWSHADLKIANLGGADLSEAKLFGANLENATLLLTNFRNTDLRKAKLASCQAMEANFQGADLSGVHAPHAVFKAANLSDAALQGAHLLGADLQEADLTRANFRSAHLEQADLRKAKIGDTDFTGANFTGAKLEGLDFTMATLGSNNWQSAQMTGCNLEGVQMPEASFLCANLTNALLTDSIMPGASFYEATLRNAGLAGVEWYGVNLNGADLTGASFHLGSSRSGLVGSPIACEGSRTGFYTDDYNEQDFKSPEEIRKANLRGADLRGAKVKGVDFYLVDLREALYDPEQAEHFRSCGAILEDRCCE